MGDCLWGGSVRAGGAIRRGRGIDGIEVTMESRAVAGTELGECDSVVPGEEEFGWVDVRRGLVEDRVRRIGVYGLGDKGGMDLGYGWDIEVGGYCVVFGKEGLDVGEEFVLEGGLHVGAWAGGVVTMWWEGWWGRRAEARNWEQSKERWFCTGRMCVSWWRWLREDILVDPVQMRRAWFWIIWSLRMLDLERLGNQIGAA